jgi:hypothetical protein
VCVIKRKRKKRRREPHVDRKSIPKARLTSHVFINTLNAPEISNKLLIEAISPYATSLLVIVK